MGLLLIYKLQTAARKKILLSWSSGKDSAFCYNKLREHPGYEVAGIFCTLNEKYSRVAMHGVRAELLKAQAVQLDLPLHIINLPDKCCNSDYERIMGEFVERMFAAGIVGFGFGDLFLEDVRAYRQRALAGSGIAAMFPLWGIDTKVLAGEIIRCGFKAVITCVDPKQMDADFVGREYDSDFLAELPVGVDACGENGEFHSFVYSAPCFKKDIKIAVGDKIMRDGFAFCDVVVG